jgi:hypothetical protein
VPEEKSPTRRLFEVQAAENKTENGYELWLKCSHDAKSGEIRQFLEVPLYLSRFHYFTYRIYDSYNPI